MTTCPHTPKYPDMLTAPTLQECISHCSLVEDNEKVKKQRALTSADGVTTRIDSPYWQGLNEAQRAAVVAHERAHPTIGMEQSCEGCADKVGGYYMRIWGFASPVVRSSFATLNVKRKPDHGHIADNAAEGARAAEGALAGRGLLGKTSSETTTTLSRLRLDAIAANAGAAAKPATSSTSNAPTAPLTTKQAPAAAPTGTKAEVGSPVANATRLAAVSTPTADEAAPRITAPLEGPPTVKITDPSFQAPPVGVNKDPTKPPAAAGSDIAGDIVSAVLGEDARPHAGKVLIAAGAAAIVAVLLVLLVRKG